MKKFTIITLSCVIFLLSFAFCFADGGSPAIIPIGDSDAYDTGYPVHFDNRITYFRTNNSPVYIVYYKNGSNTYRLSFSEIENTSVYYNTDGIQAATTVNLTNYYHGYFINNSSSITPTDSIILDGDFSSPQDVIDYVNNTVFSTTFDLTYLIDGSISWLSSMAQAVKANGLLLFFVLFIFVGVGIGLFKRFTD